MKEQLMHRVAVYGSLREGLENHSHFLAGCEKVGKCRVGGLLLHAVADTYYPGVKKGGVDDEVVLEVYEVDDDQLARLDGLEGHPSHFCRELIASPYGDVWLYFYPHDPGPDSVVASGDWAAYKQAGGVQ